MLLALPLEILAEIFSHLTRREAVGAKGTCRVLRDVCRSLESEEPGRKLHHRLRLMVACSSTAEVVEFSLRGQDPPKRVAVGRAWAKSDKVTRFRRKDGPWLTGIALSPDGDRLYCQCYHESARWSWTARRRVQAHVPTAPEEMGVSTRSTHGR